VTASADERRIDVVVPTYRRPDLLRRCLAALSEQHLPAQRVVVVVRADDEPSRRVVGEFDSFVEVVTSEPNLVAALRAGVAATTAPLIAITDDDTRPCADWLERIVGAFADPTVGCVGGRAMSALPARPDVHVGRINRFGRIVGNHDVGTGPRRSVDVVIGANMAFRADALVLPRSGVLLGTGAEPHNEVLITAWVRRFGYRVVYDPAIIVDHRRADTVLPRDDLAHARETVEWTFANAHNWFVGVTALGERSRVAVLAYGLGVGMRGSPGLVRAVFALLRGERDVLRRVPASMRGQWAGFRRARQRVAEHVVSAAALRAEGAGRE
jgi:glycosyltransferase involved in cell wall biosynthesis